MRHKDDNKQQAICDAAIELITANGFADTSMSKIAKAANVSPATIYVYFENKEQLLNQVYLFVKQEMSVELFNGVSQDLSVAEAFKIIWNNYFQYAIKNPIKVAFTEQFANSPIVAGCQDESMSYFLPILELFNRGKIDGVFKDISREIFVAFTFSPLIGLIKEHLSGQIILDTKTIETTYEIAWDAVTN